jgi:hypothetical protein
MFYKLALNTTCVIFVNFNGNKKDLWILQRLNLIVPEEPLQRYINLM